MNFIWNEIKFIHINLHTVSIKFICTSYQRTNEVNMLYPCDINEVDMRLINSSHEIYMKFIWMSNDLNFMWTSCELHKNYMTSAQGVPFYYACVWFLASLLCTSYEWASRSIVHAPVAWPIALHLEGLLFRSQDSAMHDYRPLIHAVEAHHECLEHCKKEQFR